MDQVKKIGLKKISIVCGFPFPIGYSGTNRILSYAKGFVEYSCDVSVFIFRRTENPNSIINTNHKGTYLGINYEYSSKKIVKSKIKIIIVIKQLIDIFKAMRKIFRDQKTNPVDSLIISTDNPYLVFLFSLAGRLAKIKKIVLIVDEYPKPIRYGGKSITNLDKYTFRLAFKNIHGFISITNFVLDYYKSIIRKSFSSLIVPITVENERFENKNIKKENYITYVGNLEILKDGLDILLKSFHKLIQENNDYILLLIGEGKDKKQLMKLTEILNIKDKVVFMGKVNRDNIPSLLMKSKILCLSRPTSKRAEGGFPTKLGEYLSSGVPVVVTSVGEIPHYLKHKFNAYLAQPNDIDDYKNKLIEVINNYEEATKVGNNGRELALSEFNYKYQSKRILHYLANL